jgi:hypothetical protein
MDPSELVRVFRALLMARLHERSPVDANAQGVAIMSHHTVSSTFVHRLARRRSASSPVDLRGESDGDVPQRFRSMDELRRAACIL